MVVTMHSDLGFIGTEKKSVSMMTVERPLSNLLVGGTIGLQSLKKCTKNVKCLRFMFPWQLTNVNLCADYNLDKGQLISE